MRRANLSLIIIIIILFFVSCGGEKTENINYTRIYTTTASSAVFSHTKPDSKDKNTIKSEISKISGKENNKLSNSNSFNYQNKSYKNSKNNKLNFVSKGSQNNIKNTSCLKSDSFTDELDSNNLGESEENCSESNVEPGSEKALNTQGTITAALLPLKDSDIAYITKTGKKFHRKECRYLFKSSIAIIIKEAKEKDYTACSVCKPQ